MKIMILGSDGYLGWPTSVDLASQGHDLLLIDNFTKKKLLKQYKRKPLVENDVTSKRIKLLKNKNNNLSFKEIDCADHSKFSKVFKKFKPDAVIHYAELPSAPYSMFGHKEGWKTLQNNLQSTFNLISCIKDYKEDCHVIKLGTMGEYGTPNIDIEEGWIDVLHNKRKQKFLYPRQASSLYHTSKIMDTDLLWFYVRLYGLRVTDLMQGPVYGLKSNNTIDDENLYPDFSYDDLFGTVLNRFIVQAVAGIPLTVYGSGKQIRGYINLIDTVKCVNIALKNPAKKGSLEIYNQFTEQFSVNELANKVKKALKKIDIDVKIKKMKNPRIESEKHYYNAKNKKMRKLGLKPALLTNDIIIEIAMFIKKHIKNIDKKIILPKSTW
ncbi:NAD-dependent epimerase/dehydratase family protein [Gammaproteobacteria bacterium]|nr:NAD-dependent epimerase/dehydratase family protein [Gammaproteobacteria bacterium]